MKIFESEHFFIKKKLILKSDNNILTYDENGGIIGR